MAKALHDLSTFTRIRQSGSFKSLPDGTRNVLTRRLSPSINESERHAVVSLMFTENPENGRLSLWCAYGRKLKLFNVISWICDPLDISFPSLITCMCLDSRCKLWVGCNEGQLYIVDTKTHVCGAQLASIEGEGGCRTIAFDTINNHILTGNQTGSVTVWNASNWERLHDINLSEIYETTHNTQQQTSKSQAKDTLRAIKESSTNKQSQTRKKKFPTNSDESKDQADISSKKYVHIDSCLQYYFLILRHNFSK